MTLTGLWWRTPERIPDAIPVMDPFHVVRLAGDALHRSRQRVQQDTLGHRGRADHNENVKPPANQRNGVIVMARAWYIVLAVVIVASIVIQVVLLFTGGADANSGETGESADVGTRLVRLFLFFTIDSNIVVLIVSVLLAIAPAGRGFWWEALRLNALLAITITGVVYALLIAPNLHLDGWALVTMIGLHVVSPIGFVGACLLLGPRPRFRLATIPAAFILPVAWIAITFIRGAIVDWYPYPFLDVTDIGLPAALRNALLILVAAAALAFIYRLLDARLPSLLHDSDDAATFSPRSELGEE